MTFFFTSVSLASKVVNLFSREKYYDKAAAKKKATRDLIPEKWRLPADLYPTDPMANVLDIPRTCGILTEKEQDITENYTAAEMLVKLSSGEFTSVEVTTAFCKRAAIATQLTDCCTELMFDLALARAKECDDYLAETGKVLGPLHGLPISIKDSFHVPGFDSTIGYVSFIGNKSLFDDYSALCKLLLAQGAVFYVKTNIPQTLMAGESVNNVWGRTLNPNNIGLCAGGSSGGEGALSKMRGSILGVGTDIGGSIRIPALCNGVYGFRPTIGRVPYGGQQSPSTTLSGRPDGTLCGLTAVAGPLTNDCDDMKVFFKAVIEGQPWKYDGTAKCVPFDRSFDSWTGKEKLKIGVVLEDKAIPIHPNIKKTILESAAKLKAAGHEVIIFDESPDIWRGWQISSSLFRYDGNYSMSYNIISSGEPPIQEISTFHFPPNKLPDLVSLTRAKAKLVLEWRNFFTNQNLDVLMCAAAPCSAPVHGDFLDAPYTTIWNMCDFPSVVMPVGKPLAADDDFSEYPITKDPSVKTFEHCVAPWKPDQMVGGIPHVQFVARDFEDEKLLACCSILDKVLH
ncbi:unnamed protein product [Kuraishia capsulata CBS 1993]|uniref:Amidase domain-containing protein n=1 Tax=Kuraishia capsulata CBS 1993 TaxID=1382522 RepID=W6MTL8_9ASCO|nr:uncharacterized protein KUCA_T00001087001 [Kuraishia capsulata CBS 1993]CDK25120.1 unnamed protein product [Kuraishia capsulata CBS 1993]